MFRQAGVVLLFSTASLGVSAQVVHNTTARQAAGPAAAQAPAAQPGSGDSEQQASANSTMAELQQLIQSRGVNELRTTYNGNYGASLLFKADDLTYYVALFQQKNFWRVLKTSSESQAEQTYKLFVDQTAQLADVDIRRIKLDAERAFTQRQISANESRLNTLQNDLTLQRKQEEQVTARQEQARQEASALAAEKAAASDQLTTLQRQIRALEEQQSKISGLPSAPQAAASTPARRGR